MAQIKENFAHSGDFTVCIPKASTDITSGDVVVMPRRYDPRSRATLGTLGRVSPISAEGMTPWVVGVADSDFTTTTVGSTLYATPTSDQAIPVYRKGVFRLAIVSTSGKAGQMVKYSSGSTGAQLFDITTKAGLAVGVLEKDFSGATTNDTQLVRLIEKDMHGPDLAWYLENRVLVDCRLRALSVNTLHSNIRIGHPITQNGQGCVVVIKGKHFRLTNDTRLDIGASPTGGASGAVKIRMVVARSGGFAFRTCSGTKTTMTTFTKTAVSNIYFVPTTQTSGEICIGYAVFMSAETYFSAGMLFQVDGPIMLPVGACHWAL